MELKTPKYWQQPDRVILMDILKDIKNLDSKVSLLCSSIENLHHYIEQDDIIDEENNSEDSNDGVSFDDI